MWNWFDRDLIKFLCYTWIMAGVFDIELHDPDAVNNHEDSDDDAIEVEEVIIIWPTLIRISYYCQ